MEKARSFYLRRCGFDSCQGRFYRDVEEPGQPRLFRIQECASSNLAIPTDVDAQARWYPNAERLKDKGKHWHLHHFAAIVYRLRTPLSHSGKAGSIPASGMAERSKWW